MMILMMMIILMIIMMLVTMMIILGLADPPWTSRWKRSCRNAVLFFLKKNNNKQLKKNENRIPRLYLEFQTVFDLSMQIINQKAVNLQENLHIKLHTTLPIKYHNKLHIKLHNQLQIPLHIKFHNKLQIVQTSHLAFWLRANPGFVIWLCTNLAGPVYLDA